MSFFVLNINSHDYLSLPVGVVGAVLQVEMTMILINHGVV
jgi:hypothetical protein